MALVVEPVRLSLIPGVSDDVHSHVTHVVVGPVAALVEVRSFGYDDSMSMTRRPKMQHRLGQRVGDREPSQCPQDDDAVRDLPAG